MFERFYKAKSPFVYTRVTGDLDDAQVLQHLIEYNAETEGRAGLIELSDCREVRNVESLSVQGLVESAGLEAGVSRTEGGRLAIVVTTPLHYGLARAFSEISSNFRAAVAVFYDFDEALYWLLPEDQVDAMNEFIASVPPPAQTHA